MTLRIIKGTEAIPVEHPVFLIFGQPGIGKSSLGYSLADVLTLDFDKGAHRAANRRDTLVIDTWADVQALMQAADVLAGYKAITVDTVGRCLDVITADIAATDPKKAPGGNLSQQGWGVLKARFRTWISQLRALGKDVLLIAHDREDKDGDTRIVRPDIAGGSYGEGMKVADFAGYLYMVGRKRIRDFPPTDRWVGKNPAGWQPFEIPPIAQAGSFMADLYDRGRAALGQISEAQAQTTAQLDVWRSAVEGMSTPDEINRAIAEELPTLPRVIAAPVKRLLADRAKALGFTWDAKAKAYVAPQTAAAGA